MDTTKVRKLRGALLGPGLGRIGAPRPCGRWPCPAIRPPTGQVSHPDAVRYHSAGADYVDGMADPLAYTDEIAVLNEEPKHDGLVKAARADLTVALSRSTSTQARVTAAFGGGE
jgi:hypothetical protein